jgi:hypothetical protein
MWPAHDTAWGLTGLTTREEAAGPFPAVATVDPLNRLFAHACATRFVRVARVLLHSVALMRQLFCFLFLVFFLCLIIEA